MILILTLTLTPTLAPTKQAHALLQTGVSEQNQALTGVALQVFFNLA